MTFKVPSKEDLKEPYRASIPFTPGPWWACCIDNEYERKCHCGYIFTEGNGEGTIARVYHNDPRIEKDYEPMEDIITLAQKNANACLISAAPTMFSALEMSRAALLGECSIEEAMSAINEALESAVTVDLS
jgi:hypothetical protein